MKLLALIFLVLPMSSTAIDFETRGASTAECEHSLAEPSAEIAEFARFLLQPAVPIGLAFRERALERLDDIFGGAGSAGCFSGFRDTPPGQRRPKIFAAETPDEVMDVSGFVLGDFLYDYAPQEVVDFWVQLLVESTFSGAADLTFPVRREVFASAPEPEMVPVRYRLRFDHLEHHEVEHIGHRIRLHTSPDRVQRAARTKMREVLRSSLSALDERCRGEGFACFEGSLREVDDKLEIVLARGLQTRAMSLILAAWTSNLQRGAVFEPAP